MNQADSALQCVRLFLEDAECFARKYREDPLSLKGAGLHLATDKLASSVLNALVMLRSGQPPWPGRPESPKGDDSRGR